MVELSFKVKKISLYNMGIRNIDPLAFAGLEDVVLKVNFGRNELNSLEGFKTLINLQELKVRVNKLARITASDFAPFASTLQVLDLSLNKLTIADGAFASLMSLKELKLEGCQLVTLSPTVFSDGMALERLSIGYNNFTTVPGEALSKLKNITGIKINRNKITVLPTHGFADLPKLKSLYLADNIIRKIEKEAFKNLPVLFDLDTLKDNRIEGNITKDMFVGLDYLHNIDFENNQITSVENLYTSLPKLWRLTITNNTLHCDCAIAWMRSPLYRSIVGLTTICDSPKDFKDKGMQVGSFPAEDCPMPTTTPTTTRPINTGAKIKSTICVISLPLVAMFAITF